MSSLIREIENTWKSFEIPFTVSAKTYDDEGLSELLLGKNFLDVVDEKLLNQPNYFTFQNDNSFRYYFSAYMIAILRKLPSNGNVIESMEFALTAPKMDIHRNSYFNRVGLFNKNQLMCILNFLNVLVSRGEVDLNSDSIKCIELLLEI